MKLHDHHNSDMASSRADLLKEESNASGRKNWESAFLCLNVEDQNENSINYNSSKITNMISSLVRKSMDYPVSSMMITPQEIEQRRIRLNRERAITRENKVHSIDRILRVLVGVLCRAHPKYARSANQVKRGIQLKVKKEPSYDCSLQNVMKDFRRDMLSREESMEETEYDSLLENMMSELEKKELDTD